jgi:surface polysaccharide O-acyltransferase-like enzyme
MVVVVHVSGVNFHKLDDKWWATNFYDSLVRSSVPIFVMITGALLLRSSDKLHVFFMKRAARIGIPLVFWSVFYMTWNTYRHDRDYGSAPDWLVAILTGPVQYHLWYLYALIGIYLFIPFMRMIYFQSSEKERIAYLSIWFVVVSWPTVKICLGAEAIGSQVGPSIESYYATSFAGLGGFAFLGAFLVDINARCKRVLNLSVPLVIFAICSVMTMIGTFFDALQIGEPR